ncbi:hypothetical protein TRFO_13415 [Tritrichomonas foetus]|uniref:Uncharacterized protein n=1 Tax=Tritrichomonas foetus TaxID=1144522 RepID=A0A1J4KXX4_9EUKA|nr:hypothetical protein TRFO_13415 [Tritrichomonas foetus]|eukprot:OHT16099.1 hypothetical protein TRFO_13415 [Tritrichomonas foetus]
MIKEGNDPAWMNGPSLPPLSESIIMSGLVSEKNITQPKIHTMKSNFQPTAIPNSRLLPIKKPMKSAPNEEKFRSSYSTFYSKPLKSIQTKTVLNDTPDVPLCYKPPPIEKQRKQQYIFPEKPTAEKHRSRSVCKKESIQNRGMCQEVTQLSALLDSIIAEVSENQILDQDLSEICKNKIKISQTFNYVFNQLILQEKNDYAERALLLHRIQKYYMDSIKEFPEVYNQYEQKLQDLTEKYTSLSNDYAHSTTQVEDAYKKIELKEEEIENLKEKLQNIQEESNQKDITIQSNTFDIDYIKGQLTQVKFRLQQKKDKNKLLKTAIKQRDEESKNQMNQLDAASKTIDEYKRQDIGFLPQLRKAKAELEESQAKIAELEEKIVEMKNIPKDDKNVDTSDLPKPSKKRLKLGRNSSKTNFAEFDSITRLKASSTKLATLEETPTKEKKIVRHNSRTGKKNNRCSSQENSSDSEKSLSEFTNGINGQSLSTQNSIDQFFGSEYTNASTQTETGLIATISSQQIPHHSKSTNKSKNKQNTENSIDEGKSTEVQTGKENQNDEVDLPDLLSYITPILARPYRTPTVHQELHIFTIYNYEKVIKNQKPLIWGVQLIHNFLVDPFIRSITENGCPFESIFYNWVSGQYKLAHLIKQISADLSLFFYQYSENEEYVKFFYQLLIGDFSLSEIFYIAIIYTFTVNYTQPSLVQIVEKSEENKFLDFITIPEKVVHMVVTKSFTEEMANNFIKNVSRNSENKIYFLTFLKEVGKFFGDMHKMLISQGRNLLTLCGAYDYNQVFLKPFTCFCVLLNIKGNSKKEFQFLSEKNKMEKADFIDFSDLITYCANKRAPMIDLLSLFNLSSSVSSLKSYSELLNGLFSDFRERYCNRLQTVIDSLPESVKSKVNKTLNNLRISVLKADIPAILWYYRCFVIKIDHLLMKEKGSIPISSKPDSSSITQLIEYYDRTESVAFAFLNC